MKLKRKNAASLKQFALLNASWARHLFPGSRHVVRRQRAGLRGYARQNMAAVMTKPEMASEVLKKQDMTLKQFEIFGTPV
ncbi:MAG: hypothetical protein PHP23_10465 [Desulfobacterales bacterium]|nr:hypothetical protein [Desulfobacterales bacterium]MDD4073801.1 hypothetical protein [Desulfobacterales bacterium]MDD4392317.1 hypothetical protein [Desulfobacterales bacterium]